MTDFRLVQSSSRSPAVEAGTGLRRGADRAGGHARVRGRAAAAAAALIGVTLLAGCGSTPRSGRAEAMLESTKGSFVLGSVTFIQAGDRVVIGADIRGLPPNAEVGFHIHEKGDCSSGDGMSAGGHFNPHGKPHGGAGGEHHVGDMPNLKADATGRALYKADVDQMSLGDGSNSIIGRAVIVHQNRDDYVTQPTGNAGPRLACGVIRRL